MNNLKKKFYDNYYERLIKDLEKFENKRKKVLLDTISIIVFLIVLSGILFWFYIPMALFFFVAAIFAYGINKKEFENSIKAEVMPSICKCFGESMAWKKSYENHDLFVEAGIIKEYDGVVIDDVFINKYKSVNINIIDASYKTGCSPKDDVSKILNGIVNFRGVIIQIEMNKKFKGQTLVVKNGIFRKSPSKNLKHTEFEDIIFEKKYDVFTDNPVEARYILTPVFIEKIKKIKSAFFGKNIKFAFYRNSLIISMNTGQKDWFSIGSLIRPVYDIVQFEQFLNQLVSILELIDILELNKRIML